VSGSDSENRTPEQSSGGRSATEKPEPGDDAKAKAKEMAKAYDERPTAVLPGSDRTVTGTAVNDRLDDDGKPIYGRDNKLEPQNET
jgi:type IV secretory pathway VirD2 relaxase